MHMWGGGFGFGGLFAFISMLLFWGLIILGAVFLVRLLNRNAVPYGHRDAGSSALETLRERYARGEIDTQEFEERRRTLTADTADTAEGRAARR